MHPERVTFFAIMVAASSEHEFALNMLAFTLAIDLSRPCFSIAKRSFADILACIGRERDSGESRPKSAKARSRRTRHHTVHPPVRQAADNARSLSSGCPPSQRRLRLSGSVRSVCCLCAGGPDS